MAVRDTITIWQAMEQVSNCGRLTESEIIPVTEALGRILAEDVSTRIAQPPFPRSAMDGYAVNAEDTREASADRPIHLTVAGVQYAGDAYFRPLQRGEALRIMTGAAIPEGADAVVRQEDTDYGEERVTIYAGVTCGENYCEIGEDFPQGDLLARAGDPIDAYLIAAAVAGGIDTFSVRKRIRAAMISTGDELQSPGSALDEGKIYDSNLALFSSHLKQLGCDVEIAVSVGDQLDLLKDSIRQAADRCDLILTTGGVSVGVKDLLPEAVEQLGADKIFHGISIKPGMPTMFSVLDGVPILSLSGNPYSAAAVFELLVQPLCRTMTASKKEVLRKVEGVAQDRFDKKTFCTRFLRGYYREGRLSFSRGQRNGMTKAGIGSNCLICLEAGRGPVEIGDVLTAYLMMD